jgi:hypothetical protein
VTAPLLLWITAAVGHAQSNDASLPTPVSTNEISGTIAALDVGDSRLTRHFYAFEAAAGDLTVTVSSRNLNGDLDIFTPVTFRPLMKISIYAGTIPPEVTKSVYFRSRQILILRVEARSPDDDPGSYRITFGGSFQPFSGGIPVAENTQSTSNEATSGSRNPRRLSSVGATIAQPPEPKAEEARTEEKTETEPPKAEAKPEPRPSPRNTTRGSARNRTPRTTRTKPPETTKPTPPERTETTNATPGTEKAKTEKPKTAKSRNTKPKVEPKPAEGEEKSGDTQPATPPQEPPGPHLIIEQKDGTRIDRPMSTVRRVIVEGGTIVVVLKTGKIERVPMSAVARMSIEP